LLTAAVLALIFAAGKLGDGTPPAVKATAGATTGASPTPSAYTVALPGANKATVGEHVYEIVRTQVAPRNPGELGLDIVVRFTNNGRYDANFWAAAFRLVVDKGLRAPTTIDLNEVVSGGTSKEGRVTFAVPEAARSLALVVEDAVRLPLELKKR
jgi:hypothetical protein